MVKPAIDHVEVLRQLEVDDLHLKIKHGSIELWPLIRLHIGFGLIKLSSEGQRAHYPWAARAKRLAHVAANAMAWRRGRADVLFFTSNAGNYVNVGGEMYDRYLDPIGDLCADMGITTETFFDDWAADDISGRSHASMISLGALRLASAVEARLSRNSIQIAGQSAFDDLHERANHLGIGANFPSWSQLTRRLAFILAMSARWERVLVKKQTRAIFLTCFYGSIQFALMLAAKKLGITVCDVQHGVQTEYHPAYGVWSGPPAGGYQLLPQKFFCWHKDDAALLQSWAGASSVVLSGNLWQEFWRTGRLKLTANMDALTASMKARPTVLLTMQWDSDVLDDETAAAVVKTQDRYLWLIRLHPMQMPRFEAIAAGLRAAGIDTALMRDACEAPLPYLLARVVLHVTRHSSVVIEAENQSVPTVVTSEIGARKYAAAIGRRMVFVATTAKDIVEALAESMATRTKQADVTSKDVDLDHVKCVIVGFVARGVDTSAKS